VRREYLRQHSAQIRRDVSEHNHPRRQERFVNCPNIPIPLIFGWGAYLQPHFGHLVGGAFAVLLLIVNLRTVISSDS
jgi:hypothetical protein